MIEKIHETRYGKIHYWVSKDNDPERTTLVFLPGSRRITGFLRNRSIILKENAIC